MKIRRYEVLKREFKAKDIDYRYLSSKIGRSTAYISTRMQGRQPWNQSDMYAIMELLNMPLNQLHIVFPKGGISVKEEVKPLPAQQDTGRIFKLIEVIE